MRTFWEFTKWKLLFLIPLGFFMSISAIVFINFSEVPGIIIFLFSPGFFVAELLEDFLSEELFYYGLSSIINAFYYSLILYGIKKSPKARLR